MSVTRIKIKDQIEKATPGKKAITSSTADEAQWEDIRRMHQNNSIIQKDCEGVIHTSDNYVTGPGVDMQNSPFLAKSVIVTNPCMFSAYQADGTSVYGRLYIELPDISYERIIRVRGQIKALRGNASKTAWMTFDVSYYSIYNSLLHKAFISNPIAGLDTIRKARGINSKDGTYYIVFGLGAEDITECYLIVNEVWLQDEAQAEKIKCGQWIGTGLPTDVAFTNNSIISTDITATRSWVESKGYITSAPSSTIITSLTTSTGLTIVPGDYVSLGTLPVGGVNIGMPIVLEQTIDGLLLTAKVTAPGVIEVFARNMSSQNVQTTGSTLGIRVII